MPWPSLDKINMERFAENKTDFWAQFNGCMEVAALWSGSHCLHCVFPAKKLTTNSTSITILNFTQNCNRTTAIQLNGVQFTKSPQFARGDAHIEIAPISFDLESNKLIIILFFFFRSASSLLLRHRCEQSCRVIIWRLSGRWFNSMDGRHHIGVYWMKYDTLNAISTNYRSFSPSFINCTIVQ